MLSRIVTYNDINPESAVLPLFWLVLAWCCYIHVWYIISKYSNPQAPDTWFSLLLIKIWVRNTFVLFLFFKFPFFGKDNFFTYSTKSKLVFRDMNKLNKNLQVMTCIMRQINNEIKQTDISVLGNKRDLMANSRCFHYKSCTCAHVHKFMI